MIENWKIKAAMFGFGIIKNWFRKRREKRNRPTEPNPEPGADRWEFTPELVTFYYPAPCPKTESENLSCKVEGGALDAHGNTIWGKTTLEDFLEGKGDWVTVAMDPERRDLQGVYLESDSFPGVIFRVMDVGGFGRGRGTRWVDIATRDPEKAKTGTRRGVTFRARK